MYPKLIRAADALRFYFPFHNFVLTFRKRVDEGCGVFSSTGIAKTLFYAESLNVK